MLIIFAVPLAIIAVLAARYLVVKTRLMEKSIDQAIGRRLQMSPIMIETRDLREANGIMRNLLVDFVENEDFTASNLDGGAGPREKKRLLMSREARRREIYAEASVFLRQSEPARKPVRTKRTAK